MNKKYYNPLNRLSTYYKLFYFGILQSLQNIHNQSHIPLQIIREDFAFLLNKGVLIYFDEEDTEIYDLIENNSESFYKDFTKGVYDNIPLCFDLPQLKEDQLLIDLTSDEVIAFNQFFHANISNENIIIIKEDYNDNYIYTNLSDILAIINNAILDKQTLSIKFKIKDGSLKTYDVFPIKIIHDKSTNLFALLSINENQNTTVIRFDNIKDIEISSKQIIPNSLDVLKILPNVWNNDFTSEPYKVKVRFKNEANVFKKVKRELACRTNGSLYEQNGYLYYEDIVYGLHAFKNYVFSYGSSAIVLEPKILQDLIIKSLNERLHYYE